MSEARADYGAKVTRFGAQVYKVQTLIDGGVRLSLDLIMPTDPQVIVDLFDAKQPGVMLEIAAVTVGDKKNNTDTNGKSELDKRHKRQSQWATQERPGAHGDT